MLSFFAPKTDRSFELPERQVQFHLEFPRGCNQYDIQVSDKLLGEKYWLRPLLAGFEKKQHPNSPLTVVIWNVDGDTASHTLIPCHHLDQALGIGSFLYPISDP